MSLFATGAVGYYSRIGLLPELTALQVRVTVPVAGATLHGTSLLDAAASDPSGVTKVDFRLNGDGVHDALVGVGTRHLLRVVRILEHHQVLRTAVTNSGASLTVTPVRRAAARASESA